MLPSYKLRWFCLSFCLSVSTTPTKIYVFTFFHSHVKLIRLQILYPFHMVILLYVAVYCHWGFYGVKPKYCLLYLCSHGQVDALRLRLEEKESFLNKKTKQLQDLTEEKGTLAGEIRDMKDMLEVKERKINVLQKKVNHQTPMMGYTFKGSFYRRNICWVGQWWFERGQSFWMKASF